MGPRTGLEGCGEEKVFATLTPARPVRSDCL
jgi:hypothetical protein